MKVVNLLLAALFIIFAFVQLNDPDPVLWILIYGVMAVACILAAFQNYYPKIIAALIVVYFAYSLVFVSGMIEWLKSDDRSLLLDDIAKMQYPYIEEAREYLGLLICIIVLATHLLAWRSTVKRAAT